MKKIVLATIISWVLFIGVDFLFHASLLAHLWKEDIPAIKSLERLAVLIPVGYISFLLLTILIGYLFRKIFKEKPSILMVSKFALIVGFLFAASNLSALFSFVDIPLKHLVLFNLTYFIEIIVVVFSFYYTLFSTHIKKTTLYSLLLFLGLITLGIFLQNI